MDLGDISKEDIALPSKLKKRNIAYHEAVKLMETAINNVKVPKDNVGTQLFLEDMKRDLGVITSLHYGQCHLRDAYVHMRTQNDRLYEKNKALEEKIASMENKNDTN